MISSEERERDREYLEALEAVAEAAREIMAARDHMYTGVTDGEEGHRVAEERFYAANRALRLSLSALEVLA